MKLQDLTIKEYLEKTASGNPVPGGGCASAFSGAIASALISMVANLTIGKKGHAAVEGRMREIIQEMEGTSISSWRTLTAMRRCIAG